MKTYIKPNTEVHKMELLQMIADSVKLDKTTTITNSTDNWTDLSKENNMSNSAWGSDEEE